MCRDGLQSDERVICFIDIRDIRERDHRPRGHHLVGVPRSKSRKSTTTRPVEMKKDVSASLEELTIFFYSKKN